MSIAFCSFVKRDDQGNPILDFTFWHGSVRLKIGRKSVKHINCKEYTKEEFDAIDFESLDSSPCVFWAYKGCDYVEAFQLADDKFASMMISRKDVSEFMKHDVSTAWVALCKQYDPTLEGRIAAELARRMNIQLKREPELPEHFNEDFLREYTNKLLSGFELILSDDDFDKLKKISDECIKDFLEKEHPELDPYAKLDFSPVVLRSTQNSADYSEEKGGTTNELEKRKKLNRLAKKHGLQHGHEYSRMLKRKIIRYKNRNGRRYVRFSMTPADIERMNKLVQEGHWRGELYHPSTQIVTKDEADAMELDPNVEITSRIAIDKDGHVKIQGFGLTRKPSFDLSALSKDIKPQSEKSRKLSTALFARSYDAAVMPSHRGESIGPMTSADMTVSTNQIDRNKRLILIEGDSSADDLAEFAKRVKREALRKYLKYRGKTIIEKGNFNGEVEKTEEDT